MTDITKAARAEAERRFPLWFRYDGDELPNPDNGARREGFQSCANWLADLLLSEESVEKAARALYELHTYRDDEAWPEEWGETHTKFQNGYREDARAALSAALGRGSDVLASQPDRD